jgi:hypothetical protein
MARPLPGKPWALSWAVSDAGTRTIITPQIKLRHSSKQTPAFSTKTVFGKHSLQDFARVLA